MEPSSRRHPSSSPLKLEAPKHPVARATAGLSSALLFGERASLGVRQSREVRDVPGGLEEGFAQAQCLRRRAHLLWSEQKLCQRFFKELISRLLSLHDLTDRCNLVNGQS
uniref:Uncharacterized protein n=1 Tax=Sphaerodactylus townsendi TaxID=933632 RepID=A0ACB8FBT9_9SAUR